MAKNYSIKSTAVIGAGTMGSQIAAVIANSNTPVLLLDIVSRDTNDRDALAKKAIEKLGADREHLSEKKLALIQPGNIEDDLEKLADVDWVIECVPEKMNTKRETYEKVGRHIKNDVLVSSNTSTIPLSELKRGLHSNMQKNLCITHFFNPPSKMPLLELVTDQDNNLDVIAEFARFADEKLGRSVVLAQDSAGFIANRIGMFWLLCAIEEAKKQGINITTADAIMNGAFGFPKTGVFALADLIGLKLIPDIADSMCRFLPKEDSFCRLVDGLVLIERRLQSDEEKTFYRKEGVDRKALNLNTGKYEEAQKTDINIEHWHEFLRNNTPESHFARNTLLRTLHYAADVSPMIASNILEVDSAMRDGYGWEYGPFEMINRLGLAWFIEKMGKQGLHVPLLLKQAEGKGFYPLPRDGKGKEYLGFSGRYRTQKPEKDKWTLALKTAGKKLIFKNCSAELHDIGDGIACFALTKGKMRVIDEDALELLMDSVEKAEYDFQGMIIGHDAKHFSAGLDLHIILESLENSDYGRIERLLKQGQDSMMQLKQSKVPVVAAICGYTLGGGCEMTLHCTAAQAHIGTRLGLVETDIGVIPAWGGTKEHLFRAVARAGDNADAILAQILFIFRQIAGAKKSANADDAFAMGLLAEPSRITMNRERLLPDAKELCLKLAKNYKPKVPQIIGVPVEILHQSLEHEITSLIQQEHPMTRHRCKTLKTLAATLSGHSAIKAVEKTGEAQQRAGWDRLTEQQILDAERSAFMDLLRSVEAPKAIKAVLG